MAFNTKYLTLISILLITMLIAAPFFVLSDEDPIFLEDEDPIIFEDEDPFIFEDEDPIIIEDEDPVEEPEEQKEEDKEESYDTFDEPDDINEMPGGGEPDIPNEPDEEPDVEDEPEEPMIPDIEGIGLHISAMRYDNEINAGDQLLFTIYLKNNGDIDLDNTEVTIVNQELALRAHAGPFDFNDGFRAKKRMLLEFPDEVESGVYYLRVTIDSKDVKRVVYREVDIV